MSAGLEIHDAASTGDLDSLEEYLRSGKFDVNLRDEEWNNRTALHWACAKGYVECIRLLLDCGAVGTARSDTGWTPAHFAAETGKLTALRALYSANVPLGLKDKYGDTPKRVAEIYGFTECVKFFDQCEAEIAAGIQQGIPPKFSSVFRKRRVSGRSFASSPSPTGESQSSTPERQTTMRSLFSAMRKSITSPLSRPGSALEEQREKGINNDAPFVPEAERET